MRPFCENFDVFARVARNVDPSGIVQFQVVRRALREDSRWRSAGDGRLRRQRTTRPPRRPIRSRPERTRARSDRRPSRTATARPQDIQRAVGLLRRQAVLRQRKSIDGVVARVERVHMAPRRLGKPGDRALRAKYRSHERRNAATLPWAVALRSSAAPRWGNDISRDEAFYQNAWGYLKRNFRAGNGVVGAS